MAVMWHSKGDKRVFSRCKGYLMFFVKGSNHKVHTQIKSKEHHKSRTWGNEKL